MRPRLTSSWLMVGAFFAALAGCSDDNAAPPGAGGSGGTATTAGGTAGTETGGTGGAGGFSLKSFNPPIDPGKAGILFSASGESLAQSGYAFPPANPDDAQFYDGWDIQFDRLLVTFDKIVLSANADKDPGDQSKTDAVVGQVDGPWAVDLHRETSTNIDGKSPGERSIPIAALSKQDNGTAFATDGTRYAFGFDAIAATSQAQNVNLDAAALSDYQDMAQNGCVVMYVGGRDVQRRQDGCSLLPGRSQDVARHRELPPLLQVTDLVHQLPESRQHGDAIPDEEFQRGIAFDANASVTAQLTFHTDHPFWDSVLHDSPAHFDQFAARVVGQDGGTPTATLEATKGVDYTAYKDSAGNAVKWRYCSDPPTDVHAKLTGPMAFDPHGIPTRPAWTQRPAFATTTTSRPTTRARRDTSTRTGSAS